MKEKHTTHVGTSICILLVTIMIISFCYKPTDILVSSGTIGLTAYIIGSLCSWIVLLQNHKSKVVRYFIQLPISLYLTLGAIGEIMLQYYI